MSYSLFIYGLFATFPIITTTEASYSLREYHVSITILIIVVVVFNILWLNSSYSLLLLLPYNTINNL